MSFLKIFKKWEWVLLKLLLNEQALIEKVENHDVPLSNAIKLSSPSLEKAATKWFLGGQDVLFGWKAIRQRLHNIVVNKKLSLKTQFWEPWDNKKFDNTSLEGEVVEEGTYLKRCQQIVIERALTKLILFCIDQSSDEAHNSFEIDLVKQLSYIETHIIVIKGGSKPLGSAPAIVEGKPNKIKNRKNLRTGSAALSRRPILATDSSPLSPTALRASMSL
ncbi:hypothetical protein V8G54_016449 [Vigna mungo]|uniref:Uncharacterized protein n=1 Tax=Vigna mungo TaxID=3915 RepID=A0AAQ3RXV2_VIGMU